jgi:GrpB-like predicted nucleotidyltransferase (UPF0157 family)/SAM-dependent methyltransferase
MVIVEYNENWAKQFAEIKDILSSHLSKIIRYEHIGSTSIVGMLAKPIIDLDLVVNDKHDFEVTKSELALIGYEHIGDLGIKGRETFKRTSKTEQCILNNIEHNLYVCEKDSEELERHILFRDYLNRDEVAKNEYIAIKQEIIAKYSNDDKEKYVSVKAEEYSWFFEKVIKMSKEAGYNMQKEIQANKTAWGLIAQNQYESFKQELQKKDSLLSNIITEELGDIKGKRIIHLQCNTGADTISLARKGAIVTGVDLASENIFYARKLAEELGIENANFIEANVLELTVEKKFDIVFTTEGVLCWLPDLNKWAKTVSSLLKENGFLYVHDCHPFFIIFDEEKLVQNELDIKYPYFDREPEHIEIIGGYTSHGKKSDNYNWMYKVSDIINAVADAGLRIEFFHEFDTLFYDLNEMKEKGGGTYHYPHFDKKLPFTFSLRARK